MNSDANMMVWHALGKGSASRQKVKKLFFMIDTCCLKLRFTILVIKYAYEVDDLVGATELIIKFEPKVVEM